MLSLTSYASDQFTCNDGLCVDLHLRQARVEYCQPIGAVVQNIVSQWELLFRCDGRTDCKDAADELECRVIESNPSYNRFISPPGEDKLPVMTSVTLHSFSRLDPILASYRAEFTVILSWRDARLEFINLEDQPSKNTIGPAEMEIWIPNFYLDTTRDKVENTLDIKFVLRVVRSGVGVVSSSQETENKLLFPGRENSVQYERFYSEEFHCDFFLHWYPFDHQSCYIDIKPSSNSKVSLHNFPQDSASPCRTS